MQTFINVWYNTCNVLFWTWFNVFSFSFNLDCGRNIIHVHWCKVSCMWLSSLLVFTLAEVSALSCMSCLVLLLREGLHLSIEPSIEAFTCRGKLIPTSETLFQIKIRKMDNDQKIDHSIQSHLPVYSIVFSRMFLSRIGIAWWTSFASPDCHPPIMNWTSKVCVTRSVWWNRQSNECGHVNSCSHYLPD
jgi:hypothetical protein